MLSKTLPLLVSTALLSFASAKTTYTPQECANFVALNFDIFNYADYETYFDEDSELTLAQTGVYKGPNGIEEYVKFADVTSPYVDGKMLYEKTSPNLSFFDDSTGICEFTIYSSQGLVMNKDLTVGGSINYGAIQKIYYSIPENNVPGIHIYYSTDFLSDFFGRLDTYEVHEYTCEILTGPTCEYANSFNKNMEEKKCIKKLSKLPLSEGDKMYLDSDTFGCRALHSVFAETNPANHCAHLSLTPVEDPNGKTKCQTSANISPADLFTDEELNELNNFCKNSPEIQSETCVKAFEAPEPEVDDKEKCIDARGKKGKKAQFKIRLDEKMKRNCKWVGKEADKVDERCGLKLKGKKKGMFVRDWCKDTCNSCQEN